jgi:hypothetical protein
MAPRGELHSMYKQEISNLPYLNILYAVHPDCQRNGYATEMTLGLIERFFKYSTAAVFVHCSLPDNIASAKSAGHCGFLEKGTNKYGVFRIIRKSTLQKLLGEELQSPVIQEPQTKEHQTLEKKVLEIVKDRKISVDLQEPRSLKKRPKTVEELRTWCALGYQCQEYEKGKKILMDQHPNVDTLHYSFHLFTYGIYKGLFPLVQYVLECHNNIWNRQNLKEELLFTHKTGNCTIITFLMKQDDTKLFSYLIKHPDFRSFCFETALLNDHGNTPYHTMAKYASRDFLKCFLEEKELVTICLDPSHIKGEDGMTPLELAKKSKRSQKIIDLIASTSVTTL